jgi:hypothetical protein
VFITGRGRPAQVLLTIEEYQRLTGGLSGTIDSLGLPPGVEDIEPDISSMRDRAQGADAPFC